MNQANNPFHYTGCGLDNIYLSSGVNFREAGDEYGSGYAINDADVWSRITLDWRSSQADDDHCWGRAMPA